jgi:hypothetical protein
MHSDPSGRFISPIVVPKDRASPYLALPRSTTGVIRYFQYQYSPRKFALTTNVTF